MVVERARRCAECGREFVAGAEKRGRKPKYCSDECRRTARQRQDREYHRNTRMRSKPTERMSGAQKMPQDERDERCIAFLQRRAKNVPCCKCRCRVLEGEWVGHGESDHGNWPEVDVHIWCDKGLEPSVGCPGFECDYPQRRVREFRRKGRGFGTQLVEVNRLTSLLEIDG